jgi:hypothetical protein
MGQYMAIPSLATANNDMSYVNAFYALYRNAKISNQEHSKENKFDDFDTPEKVEAFFKKQKDLWIGFAGNKWIGTNFQFYPRLRPIGYEDQYGVGAAQRALDEYSKVPSVERFDKNDSCRFSDLRRSSSKL